MNAIAKCPDEAAIKKILDGKLDPDELAEFARHISQCAVCQQSYEQQAQTLVNSVRGSQCNDIDVETDFELRRIVGDLKTSGTATIAESQPDAVGSKPARVSANVDVSFLAASESPESLGRIGIYEITEVIGQGGMGIVLKAHDPQLNRFVAIKVLNPQWGSNANSRKRFLREARAAAAVSHDHVVTIHAVDQADGIPFLVMEFVAGRSLEERIRRDGALKLREILRIGMQAASGLAAAHAQGLVHRDIKPGNILLENGVERVKITDFGLARAMDDAQITHEGVVAGTPEFMSPEQVEGESLNHISDLFSLGSVLYCMCTGRSPFRGSTMASAMRRVHDDTPRPIKEVNAEIPDWLVEIINRLLQKNPADRIQSADKVVDLLGGHLAHLQQPAVSPKPSRLGVPARTDSKATNRGRLLAAGGALLVLAVLFALPKLTGSNLSKNIGSAIKEQEEGRPQEELINPEMGIEYREAGKPEKAADASLPDQTGTLDLAMIREDDIRVSLTRDGRIRVLRQKDSPFELPVGVYDVKVENLPRGDVMRQGQVEILGGVERKLEFFFPNMRPDPPQREAIRTLVGSEFDPRHLIVSNSGKRLFTVSRDSVGLIWDLKDEKWKQRWRETLPAAVATLSPDGNQIVVGGNYGRIFVYDTSTGKLARPQLEGHSTKILCIAFGPKGRVLFSGDDHGNVKAWDCQNWRIKHEVESHNGWVKAIAVSGDASRFATSGGRNDRTVKIWDLTGSSPLQMLVGHTGNIDHLDFSPDGSVLASSGEDGMIFVWEVESGQQVARYHERGCWYPPPIKFSPSGKRLAIGSGHSISVWDWKRNLMVDKFNADWGGMTGLAFTPDGKQLVSSNTSHAVKFWEFDDTAEGAKAIGKAMEPAPQYAFNRWTAAFGGSPAYLSYSRTGLLAVGGYDNGVEVWDMKSLSQVLKPETRPRVLNLDFTSDDRLMTIGTEENWNRPGLKVWDGDTLLHSVHLGGAQMFPPIDAGGGRVIIHRPLRKVYAPASLINLADEETIRVFSDELGKHCGVAYSDREDVVAIGTWEGQVLLFHPEQDELLCEPLDHENEFVHAIAMARRASMMATGDGAGVVRLWNIANPATPNQIRRLSGHTESVIDVDFSDDGRYLATVGGDWDYTIKNHIAEICVWDVSTGNLLVKLEGHSEGVWRCEFSPDGCMLATASIDCRVKVWDVQELIEYGKTIDTKRIDAGMNVEPSGNSWSLERDTETGESLVSMNGHTEANE